MERISNVNVTSDRSLSNVNVNEWVKRQKAKAKKQSKDNLEAARKLQKALGAEDKDLAFFRKCYNRLGSDLVEELLNRATQPDVHIPLRYFTAAAKAQPQMNIPV